MGDTIPNGAGASGAEPAAGVASWEAPRGAKRRRSAERSVPARQGARSQDGDGDAVKRPRDATRGTGWPAPKRRRTAAGARSRDGKTDAKPDAKPRGD